MTDAANDLEGRQELDEFTDWHYKLKGGKVMAQQITVSAATKEPKNFGDETIWGVKVGNSWMDLHTPNRPAKGAVFTVETWAVENKGRTYVHARPVAGQQPAQPAPATAPSQQQSRPAPVQLFNGNRATSYTQTFAVYEAVATRAHELARRLEQYDDPIAAAARLALVNTCLIALGDGKLVLEPSDDWGDVAPPAGPVRYEKAQGHVHLEKTIWAYFERIGGTADDALAMLKEVSGKADVLELSEKDAIQARLKAEKFIDEHTDYLALFTAEAKKIAAKEKWDFSGTDEGTKQKKKALLIVAGINKPFKELTQADLKAAVEKLTDDVSH